MFSNVEFTLNTLSVTWTLLVIYMRNPLAPSTWLSMPYIMIETQLACIPFEYIDTRRVWRRGRVEAKRGRPSSRARRRGWRPSCLTTGEWAARRTSTATASSSTRCSLASTLTRHAPSSRLKHCDVVKCIRKCVFHVSWIAVLPHRTAFCTRTAFLRFLQNLLLSYCFWTKKANCTAFLLLSENIQNFVHKLPLKGYRCTAFSLFTLEIWNFVH